ncbi:hypothetical protein [Sanguibacter sp. HDW7]|uniref:hypothetical protein n=1 Tax=Sanguibacter sp. HDW7 TaxID=2714931 RepID=UPI00140DAB4B|nr:hypothetical protein [Sanguibacter sp. HDW7]QIK83170.1 hypothetical protein G7063_05645 [Sanguibacter sp. HDW7]
MTVHEHLHADLPVNNLPATTYRHRQNLFMTLVGMIVESRGIRVKVREERRRISDDERSRLQMSHILTDRWALMTTTSWGRRDWQGWLLRADVAAEVDDRPHSAVVWARPGHAARDSFVVLSLGAFLDLAAIEAEHLGDDS